MFVVLERLLLIDVLIRFFLNDLARAFGIFADAFDGIAGGDAGDKSSNKQAENNFLACSFHFEFRWLIRDKIERAKVRLKYLRHSARQRS